MRKMMKVVVALASCALRTALRHASLAAHGLVLLRTLMYDPSSPILLSYPPLLSSSPPLFLFSLSNNPFVIFPISSLTLISIHPNTIGSGRGAPCTILHVIYQCMMVLSILHLYTLSGMLSLV